MFERTVKNDEAIKAVTGTTPGGARGFFFDDALEAAEALPNQEIVELDKYLHHFLEMSLQLIHSQVSLLQKR